MKYTSIVDIGTNNVRSVYNACSKINLNAKITSDPNIIKSSSSVILPGVGSSSFFMQKLFDLDIHEQLNLFKDSGKMIFGICLGMQVLFSKSYEFKETITLSYLKGKVLELDHNFDKKILVPHMGWSKTKLNIKNNLFSDLMTDEFFYYVHSFYVKPEDKNIITSQCNFGNNIITSSIQKENIIGTQFHPENSGTKGIQIFLNFKKMIEKNV